MVLKSLLVSFWQTDAGAEEEETTYWSTEWSPCATSMISLEQEAAGYVI